MLNDRAKIRVVGSRYMDGDREVFSGWQFDCPPDVHALHYETPTYELHSIGGYTPAELRVLVSVAEVFGQDAAVLLAERVTEYVPSAARVEPPPLTVSGRTVI